MSHKNIHDRAYICTAIAEGLMSLQDALLESSGAVLSAVLHCPGAPSRNTSLMTQQLRARR